MIGMTLGLHGLDPSLHLVFVVALLSEALRGSVVLTWYVLARPKGSPALQPSLLPSASVCGTCSSCFQPILGHASGP